MCAKRQQHDIASSQGDTVSSQHDTASSQHDMASSQHDKASSQRDTASSAEGEPQWGSQPWSKPKPMKSQSRCQCLSES